MSTVEAVGTLDTLKFSAPAQQAAPTNSTVDRANTIAKRFHYLEQFARASHYGHVRSLIVSGPPGLGKTHTITSVLNELDPSGHTYSYTRGYVRATGLYKALYEHRFPGNVVIMDDCDFVFKDETGLGILKAVCDTTQKRTVSWKTEAKLYASTGELLPKEFEFEGALIYLTNLDFDVLISNKSSLEKHISAIMSRAHYIDLELKNRIDYMIRVAQVVNAGMLNPMPIKEQREILEYISRNIRTIREVSLRMVVKLRDLKKSNPQHWQEWADVTCIKDKL